MTLLTTTASAAGASGGPGSSGEVSYGWLGDIVVSIMEAIGPVGVAVAVFAENLFPPIPSELILPLAGFTAAGGQFGPWEATIWATVGSVVGALMLYGIGAWLGRVRMYRIANWLPLVDIDDVERTERWFNRYGYWTVLLGRMVPIFRSLISIPAGIERMNLWLFTLFTLIGSGVWNTIFVWGGFLLGENWHVVSDYADVFSNIVLAAVVIFLVSWITTRVLRNRRRAKDPDFRQTTPEEAAARMDALLSEAPGQRASDAQR
ncbi:DedA family protein [Citricoccus nitrophenolicus]|uniref:DedA family protein n=1 Tax=Citricoccus nitrophenolicus TaxID=863575 RepID=UPI003614328C